MERTYTLREMMEARLAEAVVEPPPGERVQEYRIQPVCPHRRRRRAIGGAAADLAGLVGEILEVRRAPIRHEIVAGQGTLAVGQTVSAEMASFASASGASQNGLVGTRRRGVRPPHCRPNASGRKEIVRRSFDRHVWRLRRDAKTDN